ncbi:G-box-binding factor 4 [Acorus gramineus]|uniref:G-box-binding factor 4 n=1 Tax=Acorus gramineus TaxID=55184 RepID=A0AAV9BKK5_ACOGR|nr:G-box-binding factor 4 [Acorus gramineus]
MASSRVMGSSSTANPSPSAYSLASMGGGGGGGGGGEKGGLGSMNMEELLRNMYADNPPSTADMLSPAAGGEVAVGRTAEEVWREISGGGGVDRKMEEVGEGGSYGGMTLEDFLAKAGAVSEEDIRVPVTGEGVYVGDQMYQVQQQQQMEVAFVNGVEAVAAVGGGGGGGRGKRRAAVQEPVVVVDRVAQQRQRRMIKNRESAARSRERKQAYTVELESQVTQLEEEHARLTRVQVHFLWDFDVWVRVIWNSVVVIYTWNFLICVSLPMLAGKNF